MTDQPTTPPTGSTEMGQPVGEFNFDAWLAEQPEATRGNLTQYLSGLKSALDKEREARKALEKDAKKASQQQKDAELATLAEQQKWQELAARHEARVKELEAETAEVPGLRSQIERYSATIKKRLEAERTGLPEHLIALLDKLEPLDQLDYLTANAAALRPKSTPPPPPSPLPAGDGKPSDAEARRRAYQSSL